MPAQQAAPSIARMDTNTHAPGDPATHPPSIPPGGPGIPTDYPPTSPGSCSESEGEI